MSKQEGTSPPREKDLPRWLMIGAPSVAVILLIGTLLSYFYNFHGQTADQETWGQFGDFVGGVLNPFLAFLAFVLLLATLHLQNRELQNSSRELAKSAEALKLQNDALTQQNFENTFFQMLRRISDLVSQTTWKGHYNIATGVRPEPVYGREAFERMFNTALRVRFNEQALTLDTKTRVEKAYQEFYSETRGELGPYFRSLYHLFTFINRSNLSENDKSIYANIVRAQLSTYELCLLFYNGLWGEGRAGFKPLIEKYGILKHIDASDLIDPGHKLLDEDFYERTAFMGREERLRHANSIAEQVRQVGRISVARFNLPG